MILYIYTYINILCTYDICYIYVSYIYIYIYIHFLYNIYIYIYIYIKTLLKKVFMKSFKTEYTVWLHGYFQNILVYYVLFNFKKRFLANHDQFGLSVIQLKRSY